MTKPINIDLLQKELMAKIGDREWRIDHLYRIKDKKGDEVIFKRNANQRLFWADMWYLNIILKARQQGFSTLIAIFILDFCLFNQNSAAGIIDITLDDAKKKLAKIKFAYDGLPPFLKDAIKLTVDNKETLEFSNGSSIYVGTSHRGGTLQVLHISEMGKISVRFPDRAREVRTGALNTIAPGCFIFNESTAEGNSGEFFEDCQTAIKKVDAGEKLTQLDYRFHFFGWWQDETNVLSPEGIYITPEDEKYLGELEGAIGHKLSERQRAWWAKKASQQRDDMGREYPGTREEAFAAAVQGTYLSGILTEMRKRDQITVVPVERSTPVNTGWDFGISDHMTIWLHQQVGQQHRLIGYLSGTDDDVLYYWSELQRRYDVVWGNHFLPHDAAARRIGTSMDAAGPPRTIEDILRQAGMRNTKIVPRIQDKYTAIQETKLWLPSVLIDRSCAEGIKALDNFKREWDEINGCWKNRPRHDWAMHGYDGLETLVRGLGAYQASDDDIVTTFRAPGDWRAM